MAAEVEAVAVRVDDGLGQAADLVLGLEDDDLAAGLGQQVAGGQAGGASADDDVGTAVAPVVAVRADGGIGFSEAHAPRFTARGAFPAGPLTPPNHP